MFGALDRIADQLAQESQKLSRLHDNQPVLAIGHSQGGVALRRALFRHPDCPIQKIITLGSPHRGTRLALLGVGTNAAELRRNSILLSEMAALPCVPLVSIYSQVDALVYPATSAAFGSKQTCVDAVGHFGLLIDGQVFEILRREIEQVRSTP